MKEFKTIEIVKVSLDFPAGMINVGRLALSQGKIYFEYDATFLERALPISPFKLPLKPGVEVGDRIFDGLFGVFNDSLPDGWGKLLLG